MVGLREQIGQIERSMRDFARECKAEGDDCGYRSRHIRRCGKILQRLINALSKMPAAEEGVILAEVEKAVVALNRLNEQTEYALIKTDERESIAAFIREAAVAYGLRDAEDDITEEWREW